jgi:hypothetical protein
MVQTGSINLPASTWKVEGSQHDHQSRENR